MTVIRRSIGLLTAISLGLLFPTVSHGTEVSILEVNASEAGSPEVSSDVNRQTVAVDVDIEERLEPVDGRINFEQTFSGNADEIIVIYTEGEGGIPVYSMGYGGRLFLLDPDGEQVFFEYDYPTGIDLADEGSYFTVRLPKTGEYRVIFEDGPLSIDGDYVASSRVLQIRPATYYERLIIGAEALVLEDRSDESLALLALAIEENSELPAPYISRLFIYVDRAYNTPEFNEKLEQLENSETGIDESVFGLVHETFTSLDSTVQSLLISDIRQIATSYQAAMAQGEAIDEFFPPEIFSGVADFLETGEPTDALRMLLFGTSAEVSALL